jgi:competence protein ComEC
VERHRTLLVVCLSGLLVLTGCVGPAVSPAADASGATPAGSQSTPTANGTVAVHVIDVGQAESTLIVGPTETILVDTGDFTDDGAAVLRYLKARGIERIDHLVVTHADADHIGGTAAVIRYFEQEAKGVGAIYDPGIAASTRTYERYLDAVEEFGVTLYETRAGDRLDFADADVDVLGPPEPYLVGGERNENSIVLDLTHGAASFLLTGDAGRAQEQYLVETYGKELRSTVLKTGHHGSDTSTTAPFLDAVSPVVATVSSAYDSRYGHPDEAVLDRLAERNVTTFWTATHGAIRFTSDGRRVSIATQRPAPTNPAELRAGEPPEPDADAPLQQRAVVWAANRTTAATTAPIPPPKATMTNDSTAGNKSLALVEVHADAAGDDWTNLDDEYVVFANRGDAPLNLTGWTVRDGSGATYTFPAGFTLAPGARVTLRTGTGTDSATDLYWRADRPVWNNGGDTVTVTTAKGVRVLTEAYG